MVNNKVILIFVIIMILACIGHTKSIKVVTLYGGTLSNEISRVMPGMNLDLKDSNFFSGLYIQSVKPELYQWNAFIYGSKDINNSDMFGSHFIADIYPCGSTDKSKFVLGAGFEFIDLKTQMDDYEGLTNFELKQKIYAPYLRSGNYFYFGKDKLKLSLMPWVGLEGNAVRGDIFFNLPPNPNPYVPDQVDTFTNSSYFYALAGNP